ncbi:MAG: prepilin-type N-terminal cleavage/methylation domain-containing protein [Candidatus Hydrogenedentes bacterium]|nr:prepilin-type N-terminal cleavage/methylation domain-containing protein [Candidatus Hydrogenedentota bacterium]
MLVFILDGHGTRTRRARQGEVCLSRNARDGYTLLELMFVVFVIALVLAVAMPQLMPAFLFSQHEGAARRLANYGRSAVAYSAMNREPITVRFDLANGEYWCLRWNPEDLGADDGSVTGDFFGDDDDEKARTTGKEAEMDIHELMAIGTPEEIEQQSIEVMHELELAFRRSLETQAKNVPRDSILGEFDPLFEAKFSLETDDEQEREEISDSLLDHGRIPEDIRLESILLAGEEIYEGIVDVEVTPLGLNQSVSFFIKGPREQYYTVVWDPITGGAHLTQGKEAQNALMSAP